MCAFKETHYNTCIDSQLRFGRILKNSFSTSDKRTIEINVPITIFFLNRFNGTKVYIETRIQSLFFLTHSIRRSESIDFVDIDLRAGKLRLNAADNYFDRFFPPFEACACENSLHL